MNAPGGWARYIGVLALVASGIACGGDDGTSSASPGGEGGFGGSSATGATGGASSGGGGTSAHGGAHPAGSPGAGGSSGRAGAGGGGASGNGGSSGHAAMAGSAGQPGGSGNGAKGGASGATSLGGASGSAKGPGGGGSSGSSMEGGAGGASGATSAGGGGASGATSAGGGGTSNGGGGTSAGSGGASTQGGQGGGSAAGGASGGGGGGGGGESGAGTGGATDACVPTCSTSHVGSSCVKGKCAGTCDAGFADCNESLQIDGCEADLSSDVHNCGACGVACKTSCTAGVCDAPCGLGFPGPPLLLAGLGVTALATTDLDGDGWLDFVTANYDAGTVSVILRPGGVALTTEYPAGKLPFALAIADVDGDLLPDVLVADYFGPVLLLKNLGGKLAIAQETSFAGHAASVSIADVDGDALPDLLVSDPYAKQVVVAKNQGGGTFAAQSPVVSSSAQSIVASDLDHDGDVDLVLTLGSDDFRVAFNEGGGVFAPPVVYAAKPSPLAPVIADFDGNGAPDVALPCWSSDVVAVFLNVGDGTFGAETDVPVAMGSAPGNVVAADFDADGYVDLAALSHTNTADERVFVARGLGGGGFDAPVSYLVTSGATDLVAGDFDADGVLDLATSEGGQITDYVEILGGRSNGTFIAPTDLRLVDRALGVAVGDVDGDGLPDVVATNQSYVLNDPGINVFANQGGGNFAQPVHYDCVAASQSFQELSAPTLADFDGDGRLDVAFVESTFAKLYVLLNTGSGFAPVVSYDVGADPNGIAAADFDGDGDIDLAVSDFADGSVGTMLVIANDGTGSFGAPVAYTVDAAEEADAIAAGDFDGDGKPDLAVSFYDHGQGGDFAIFPGNGDGTFRDPIVTACDAAPVAIVASDLDHDGRDDVVLSTSHYVSVFFADGAGADYPTSSSRGGVALGDIDGDGDLDVVAGSGRIGVFLNRGAGDLVPAGLFPTAADSVALADLDGDGRADAAGAIGASIDVAILLSTCR